MLTQKKSTRRERMSESNHIQSTIAGIGISIFGELVEQVESYKVVYFIHGRKQDQSFSNAKALELLKSYKGKDLLVVTFDCPNHGSRVVDPKRNQDIGENSTHVQDMLSIIDGTVEDVRLIREYLDLFIPGLEGKKLTHIVSGFSMGAHSTIRAVARYPELFTGAVPICGCFDLGALLSARIPSGSKIPDGVVQLCFATDIRILQRYDTKKLRTLAMFGNSDKIVPSEPSIPFIEKYTEKAHLYDPLAFKVEVFNAGHEVTGEMVDTFALWLDGLD